MEKRSGLTKEELDDALMQLPDVLFLLVGDLYYTVCCDAFEFHSVPEKKRNLPMAARLKAMREHPGRPFLVGREMTEPEHDAKMSSRSSGIVAALEKAFENSLSNKDAGYTFDIRLIAYNPRENRQDPFDYYSKPVERNLFGVQYDRGLIRFSGKRMVAVTENLIDSLRACVADRIKSVENEPYTWEDIFSPNLHHEVFRCWQTALDF